MKNIKQILRYSFMILGGIIIGWIIFGGNDNTSQTPPVETKSEKDGRVWTCSMHPQIKQDKPGKCPLCAMDLIPLNTMDDEESADIGKIQMSESAVKIAEVQTNIVQKLSSGKEIRLSGKVQPDERKIAVISSRFGGRIENLFVNFTGQEVIQGEKLATVFSPDLITAQKELFEAIKFKQSNPEYYKAARTKLKLWSLSDSQIAQIEQNGEPQNYFDILAPLGGTVMKREIALGDYVEQGTMLFEIADLSAVWILLDAYETDLPWIRTGDDVNFEAQSLPGKIFSGTVTFINPVMDPENRVAYIRIEINNPENALKPEMFVRGIIKTNLLSAKNALAVPKSAVLWTGKKAIVYVKDRSKTKPVFEYREIQLGEDAAGFYVVKGGLQEGEEIVTNGVFKVDAAAQLEGKKSMMNSEEETKVSFTVFGNCEMCKERIEKAAKSVESVTWAHWNEETKLIEVSFAGKTEYPEKVSKAIAKEGYDTEYDTAGDDVYSKLPSCCQYDRK